MVKDFFSKALVLYHIRLSSNVKKGVAHRCGPNDVAAIANTIQQVAVVFQK
jgi:hypothetical protein